MTHDPGRRVVLRRLGQASLVLGGSGLAAWLGVISRGRWADGPEIASIPRRTVPPRGCRVTSNDLKRPAEAGAAQPGHRGVERDAVDPGRQGRVAAEGVELADDFHDDVLGNLLGVFPVLHIA